MWGNCRKENNEGYFKISRGSHLYDRYRGTDGHDVVHGVRGSEQYDPICGRMVPDTLWNTGLVHPGIGQIPQEETAVENEGVHSGANRGPTGEKESAAKEVKE